MTERVVLDADDRRVLHALQLDGRASFARIANALGLSERTVSRRYHRLRSQLVLRVVGVSDHARPDRADWLLHITPPSGAASGVARTLAARADTSWIATLTGTGGLTGILRTSTRDAGEEVERLRRRAGIGTVRAQRLLTPVAGVGGWPVRLRALTTAEQAALTPEHGTPHPMTAPAGEHRGAEDEQLLTLLAADGRTSVARLATGTGVPESTVRRRITDLRRRGALLFEVEIDPVHYGREVDVLCWFEVAPAALREVTRALGTHPEVAFAATTTGPGNIVAFLEFATATELHDYLADRIGALPGVVRVRTEIVGEWVKRAGPRLLPRT